MEDKLTINTSYAEKYERRKKAEELSKLQEKYGDDLDTESSTSEEEDDDAIEDTTKKTKEFLCALSLIKKRDPRIYDKETKLYDKESPPHEATLAQDTAVSSTVSAKPLYLRDYERQRMLEKGTEAELSDSESEGDGEGERSVLTYNDEQRKLKNSFIEAADTSTNTDLLTLRVKTHEEKEAEEADYIKWLKGLKAELKTAEADDMDTLRRYWTDPQLDPEEVFLRDYILNKRWIDQDDKRIPTYDEVTRDQPSASEDEDILEEQDVFERKYNFRYEEPGGTSIIGYPRNIDSSVRKKDETRKEKRKAREDRKTMEKQQKREELKRLKNLKKQEIVEKLEKLKKLTGNPTVGFSEEDLEGEFDPCSHDATMKRIFDNHHYQEEKEEEKPIFSDSEEEEENWDEWVPPTTRDDPPTIGHTDDDGPHCEDPDFNMDADYQPESQEDGISKRKRKRASLFSRAIKRQKPVFNPDNTTFDDYFDEYYNLDYEDLIGDIPCRFHYRSVIPNDFGLSTEEILTCEDRELNKWVSLKKAVQYRTKEEEKRDIKKYRLKSRDLTKKNQILTSFKELEEQRDDTSGEYSEIKTPLKLSKKKSKRKKMSLKKSSSNSLSDTRLAAYGLNTTCKQKKKNKKK